MNDRITIEGRDGTFGAYMARPKICWADSEVEKGLKETTHARSTRMTWSG